MISTDTAALFILGAFFALLGLIAILLWIRETRSYDYQLGRRLDAREFLTHWPNQPWLMAWRVGGWLSLFVGLGALIAASIMLWFR